MSTLGKQGVAPEGNDGQWERVSRDMIRTKRNADGSGGIIVAQFWTAPTEAHAQMMAAAPELVAALQGLVGEHIKRGGAFDEPCGSSEQTPEINAALAALKLAGAL